MKPQEWGAVATAHYYTADQISPRDEKCRAEVAIAKAEVPSLVAVQVGVDGSLEGLDRPVHDPGAGPGSQAEVVVVAQLLGLLVTFIGAPLTLRLVRDAWPDTSVAGMDDGNEDGL